MIDAGSDIDGAQASHPAADDEGVEQRSEERQPFRGEAEGLVDEQLDPASGQDLGSPSERL